MLVVGTTGGVLLIEPEAPAISTNLSRRSVNAVNAAGEHLLAGVEDGVYRSVDGGHTWTRVGLEGCEVLALAVSPTDPDVVLASTRPPALYRSTDRGTTWTRVDAFNHAPGAETWGLPFVPGGVSDFKTGARAHTIIFDPHAPGRYWVGVEVGALVGTEDDGASWWSVVPCNDPDVHAVVADPIEAGKLYLSAGFGRLTNEPREQRVAGMFGSDDGGRTWFSLWEGMHRQYTRPLCVDPRGPHAITVGSTPVSRPYVHIELSGQPVEGGAQGVVYQSVDRGRTWQSLGDEDHSPSVAAPMCVTPAPEGPGQVLVGTDQGEVWRVTPDRQWHLLASDLPIVNAVLPLASLRS